MAAAPRLVDMRIRPSFLHPFFGSTPGCAEFDTVRWLNRRVGSNDPDHFTRSPDLGRFLVEMDEAGIATGVMVGRSTPTVRISNDALADIARQSKGRLIGIASVDPLHLGSAGALAELERAVTELNLRGVNFDAGFYATPLRANDGRLLPLYEACERLGVPACIMSGPTTPDLAYNDPLAVDDVARLFPGLTIICCHGFYPRIADIVAVAFRHENVVVSPDMYTWAPGGRLYLEAANGFMQDQFLFGSSYPFRPIKQGVADFLASGLAEDALAKAGYLTARRIFKFAEAETAGRVKKKPAALNVRAIGGSLTPKTRLSQPGNRHRRPVG